MGSWTSDIAQAYADLGQQTHIDLLSPVIRSLCGDLTGRTALDFGCGGGELSLQLAKWGAQHITCIDQQPHLVQQTRERFENAGYEPARYDIHLGSEDRLAEQGQYDVVLCSLMLMMCATRDQLHRVTARLLDRLAPNGQLIVVLTHPCFRGTPYPTFHYAMAPGHRYWNSGEPYEVVLNPPDADPVVITDHHWMIQDYVGALHAGGGIVRRMRELPGAYHADGKPHGDPAYLIIEAAGISVR